MSAASVLNMHGLLFLVIIPYITQYNNYLPSIYIVLGIIHNLEMTYSMREGVRRLYANTMPFYIRDLRDNQVFTWLVHSCHSDFNPMAPAWKGFYLSISLKEVLLTPPSLFFISQHVILLMAMSTIWIVSSVSLFTCYVTPSHPPCHIHSMSAGVVLFIPCIPSAWKRTQCIVDA